MRRSFTLSRADTTRDSGACRTPSGRSRFGLRTGDTVKGQIRFTGGIAKAERQHVLSAMCDHMLKLYRLKYPDSDEGNHLVEWVRQACWIDPHLLEER